MASPLAGSSNVLPSPPSISGTTPGILDPSQAGRLLRLPTSKLSFASFDPRTAHIDGTKDFPDLSRLSLDEQGEHCRPKRIVIETTPQGASFWRFVPRARMGEGIGLHDEGFWPRVLEICGEKVHCTQEQWDIYKLDPEYDCVVQLPPKLSIISRIKPKEKAVPVPPKTPSRKRQPPSPHSNLPPQSAQKKSRPRSPSNASSSSSEEDMSVDEIPRFRSQTAALGRRARKLREQNERNRKARREKILRFQAKRDRQEGENMFSPTEDASSTPKPRFQSMPTQSSAKRKVPALDPSLRPVDNRSRPHPDIQEEDEDDPSHREPNGPAHKRTRTTSPECARKTTSKRAEREKGKQQRWGKIIQDRKVNRDQRLMNDILADVPEFVNGETNGPDENVAAFDGPSNGSHGTDRNSSDDIGAPQEPERPVDEETARRSAVAESIRKLQDLEKDKPLWDEAAKKRIQRETVEEDERRAKAEERRRAAAWKAELEMRAKAEKEGKEARARAEAERQEREAKHTKQKRQERQRWESGPWTASRALDRYKVLCDSFDNAKFSQSKPLTFEDVPWPVLSRSFSVEDVDWAAVERFFEAVKYHMRGDEYSGFVEKSHRRFHPDRWKSRRLLTSIADHGDRECMEVAANTVAQALTPLWRNLKEQ